jgi:hypothetical protein
VARSWWACALDQKLIARYYYIHKAQGHLQTLALQVKPQQTKTFFWKRLHVAPSFFCGSAGIPYLPRSGGHMIFPTRILALCAFLFSIGAAMGHAQSTATLSGTVTDPSGAVVPQAQMSVRIFPPACHERVVKSDAAGNYTVPSLQPGNYSVSIQAAGFAAYKLPSMTLQVDQAVTANAKLGVASTGEVVQVQGAAPILDAATMTVGQVIDQKTVQEIPLNGRHFLDLTNLAPGTVVPPVTGSLTSASRGLGANSYDHGWAARRLSQLHDQRHQPERCQPEPDHLPAFDQHHVRVQDLELDLFGGVRPLVRFHRQRGHALGHQHHPWGRVRLPAQ